MNLFYRTIGKGQPLVILHGLYGMSDNWISIARQLEHKFTIWIPDLRNHGRSPHANTHTYADLAHDVFTFITVHKIQHPILLGHSMGGKAAMTLVHNYPGIIKHLIVADIAPVNYSAFSNHDAHQHKNIINSLLSIELKQIHKREDVDRLLAKTIHNRALRAFLSKNLQRDEQHNFFWLLNLPVIMRFLPHIIDGFDNWEQVQISDLPVTFLRGENSFYIYDSIIPLIHNIFTRAEIITIPHAGHWLHAENPQAILNFLNSL